jgi:apolipoprotein N-acyltransferase
MVNCTLWRITLLSALAYNLAWLCLPVCAWLVVPSIIALCWVDGDQKSLFCAGLSWGFIVFGWHFHWLGDALVRHISSHPVVLCAVAVIIFYFALLAGLLFCALGFVSVKRWRMIGLLPMVFFFMVIDQYGLVPLGLGRGYPFCNPVLPLGCYSSFLQLVSMVMDYKKHPLPEVLHNLAYVQPVVNRAWGMSAPWAANPHAVACRLGRKITARLGQNSTIIVGPESAFLFPLNNLQELLGLLAPRANNDVLLGAILTRQQKNYQAVYHCRNGLIINFYVKRIMVPFVEAIPPAWQWLEPTLRRWASEYVYSDVGSDALGASFFKVQGCSVRPLLCYEFFMQPLRRGQADIVMAFVNDSWYTGLFRRWLLLLAMLKSHFSGVPVVYIGHYGCYTIALKK